MQSLFSGAEKLGLNLVFWLKKPDPRRFKLKSPAGEDALHFMGGGSLPVELRLAMLLLTAHWYRLREAVAGIEQSLVPMAYDFLVKPFVKLTIDN